MRSLSIIYAYRNREVERIKLSLSSIESQINESVEVIFVDYGSTEVYSDVLEDLLKQFNFVQYYYLESRYQLWNKSRALNYGIQKSSGNYIFIADVDLIFTKGAINKLQSLGEAKVFYLFTLGYLNKSESKKLHTSTELHTFKPFKKGRVNGMLLVEKEALLELKGYDEFYHFYGSEDVDMYARLENGGYQRKVVEGLLFYHIWHEGYQKANNDKLSLTPRLSNALRINQQHYFFNKKHHVTIPYKQDTWGRVPQHNRNILDYEFFFSITNTAAEIEHYFNEVLTSVKKCSVIIEIKEDDAYKNLKYLAKRILGRGSQRYFSMKEVNDYILKKIVFNYRNHYYSYIISPDLKMITFKVQL